MLLRGRGLGQTSKGCGANKHSGELGRAGRRRVLGRIASEAVTADHCAPNCCVLTSFNPGPVYLALGS